MNVFDAVPPEYRWPVQFCAFTTATTYVLSLITSNVSQVDRLWTFLPTIYTGYYALLPLWSNEQPKFPLIPYTPKDFGWATAKDFSPRALLMFGLVVVWMCRLTYNTNRRGLFGFHEEDYRWTVLRKQLAPWHFQVTNLTFISVTQNVLLLLLGLPTKVASTQPHTPLAPSDYILASLALVVLGLEFTADNQQWAFQTYKHAFLAKEKGEERVERYDARRQWLGARLDWKPEDAQRGFVTKGLWRYSRHPNSMCEQTFWWIITLMPLLSPSPPNLTYDTSINLSLLPPPSMIAENFPYALIPFFRHLLEPFVHVIPALALTALVYASLVYTEGISASKYPEGYKAYQERVGMLGVIGTLEKGLLLKWKGRREEVEAIVWGEEGKTEKVE